MPVSSASQPFTSSQLASEGANPNMYKPPVFQAPTPQYSIPGTNDFTTNPQQSASNSAQGNLTSVPGVGIQPMGTYGANPAVKQEQPYAPQVGAPSIQGQPQQPQPQVAPPIDNIETPAQNPIGQKYQQAFNTLQQTGGAAPVSSGQARVAVAQAAPTPSATEYKPTPQFIQYGDPVMQQFIQSAITQQQDITTKGYLAESIKQNSSNLMAAVDQKAMNLKNMIEGTEDDIRMEIGKGGGFATESQVQALANSRNKDLIRSYNSTLLEKQNMQQQMTAQVQLADLDRQYAKDKYDNTVQAFNMYKTIDSNAQTSLDKLVGNVGYSGLAAAYGNDPYTLGLAESKLGLPNGTLTDPNKLKFLETYREQSLAQGQQRLNINIGSATTADPDVLNGMVSYYSTTGSLPPFGMGNAALRTEFWKAVGQGGDTLTGQAAANKAAISAASSALRNQQTQASATQTSLNTFDSQLDLVKEYSDKVDRTGSPIVNKYLLALKGQVAGDADTAAFENVIKTASTEFAKIMSGSSASIAGATVSSAEDAEKLINSKQTPAQISEVMNAMRREAQYRVDSYNETTEQLKSDITNIQSGKNPKADMVSVGGNQYEVGALVTNSRGEKGRVEKDGTITKI